MANVENTLQSHERPSFQPVVTPCHRLTKSGSEPLAMAAVMRPRQPALKTADQHLPYVGGASVDDRLARHLGGHVDYGPQVRRVQMVHGVPTVDNTVSHRSRWHPAVRGWLPTSRSRSTCRKWAMVCSPRSDCAERALALVDQHRITKVLPMPVPVRCRVRARSGAGCHRAADLRCSTYQAYASAIPSRRPIHGAHPRVVIRETSRTLRGVPSGWAASHSMAPW